MLAPLAPAPARTSAKRTASTVDVTRKARAPSVRRAGSRGGGRSGDPSAAARADGTGIAATINRHCPGSPRSDGARSGDGPSPTIRASRPRFRQLPDARLRNPKLHAAAHRRVGQMPAGRRICPSVTGGFRCRRARVCRAAGGIGEPSRPRRRPIRPDDAKPSDAPRGSRKRQGRPAVSTLRKTDGLYMFSAFHASRSAATSAGSNPLAASMNLSLRNSALSYIASISPAAIRSS